MDNLVKPILKWAGGKRQIKDQILQYMPQNIETYYEPFFGGGAILFELQPTKAVVNDINTELINFYEVVKNNVDELIEELKTYTNDSVFFYKIRALDKDKNKYDSLTNIEKAARVLYLNKTCFNGLYRVNKAGEFNVPFGKYKKPNIVDIQTLKAVNMYFNNNDIMLINSDFTDAVKQATEKDFVYFDPPYDPISETSSFTSYDKTGFDKNEQTRLKELCDELTGRNVKFILSSSSTDFIKELYKDYNIQNIKAKRSINSKGTGRGKIDELLIMNY